MSTMIVDVPMKDAFKKVVEEERKTPDMLLNAVGNAYRFVSRNRLYATVFGMIDRREKQEARFITTLAIASAFDDNKGNPRGGKLFEATYYEKKLWPAEIKLLAPDPENPEKFTGLSDYEAFESKILELLNRSDVQAWLFELVKDPTSKKQYSGQI